MPIMYGSHHKISRENDDSTGFVWVLTAGHCIKGKKKLPRSLSPNFLRVLDRFCHSQLAADVIRHQWSRSEKENAEWMRRLLTEGGAAFRGPTIDSNRWVQMFEAHTKVYTYIFEKKFSRWMDTIEFFSKIDGCNDPNWIPLTASPGMSQVGGPSS